jgi:hypothetical protein
MAGGQTPLYGKEQEIVLREFKYWKLYLINL